MDRWPQPAIASGTSPVITQEMFSGTNRKEKHPRTLWVEEEAGPFLFGNELVFSLLVQAKRNRIIIHINSLS
jgi:hypothetical protein